MARTQEEIMAQVWIAFGQGTGTVRVSLEAAMELHRRYYDWITPQIDAEWESQAVQVLDRFRAIGSLAAAKAASAGASAITPREIYESASALLENQETEAARDVRLSAALATTPAFVAEISNLELLDDSALWNAAQTRMPQPDSERMEELHRKQRGAGLSEAEVEELARLEQQYDRVILVRSHSASLLEKRGHDLRSLFSRLAPGG
ncbi:MAG TPA: hypothetical protein VF789_18395 [Thermoanaerobaculia bacterium]